MVDSLIGKTIGKYQIIEHLGRGGMAEVYKAYQPALDRYVAIKVMHSYLAEDEDFLARFQREAKAVGRLRHPNIVQVHDFDVAQGIYYMVMEFIDGFTLKAIQRELANNNDTLALDQAIRITKDIASALAYAHEREMVHRDIKPANVMINKDGQVILTDFGIAKILSGPQYTASGAMIGTPAYMSPEQGLGEPGDARSDIYSLGVMLFQMTTGQLPYDADTPVAIVLKHVNDPLPIPSSLNPDIPPEIERVILKALAKEPEHRYQSAQEMLDHLDRIEKGLALTDNSSATVVASPAGQAETVFGKAPATISAPVKPSAAASAPAGGRRRPKWFWAGIGAASLVVVVLIAAGVALGMSGALGKQTPTAAPTSPIAAVSTRSDAVTAVAQATTPPPPTNTPEPTPTLLDPVFAAQTALAQQNATLTAQAPTVTPTPEPTLTPSLTPTPACEYGYELIAFFTYDNPNNYNSSRNQTSAPSDSRFPLTIQLRNASSCAWPTGTMLTLVSDQAAGAESPLVIPNATEPEALAEFKTELQSTRRTGILATSWQLTLPDNTEIGAPFEIRVLVYLPATPTPTLAPQPTATSEVAEGPIDFNYFVQRCEYAGDQWRCLLILTPYGGIGQPYTFWVRDTDPPARYYGGNQEHWVQSRRCSAWIHEISLQDDGGNAINKNVYINPDDHFPGGCTLP